MASKSPFPPAGSVTAAHAASPNPPPVKDSFGRLVDGLQSLFREHLALARLEIRDDLKRIVKDVALSAAGVPLLFVGYVMLMVALGFLLARVVPDWAAFGIVALVNLGVGAALAVVFGKRIGKQDKVDMARTQDELQRDKAWMATLREGTKPQPIPGALAPQGPTAPVATWSTSDKGRSELIKAAKDHKDGKPVPLPDASMPPADARVARPAPDGRVVERVVVPRTIGHADGHGR